MENESGEANCTAMADSAPATPVYSAETPKVSDLYSAVFTPIALRGDGLVADGHQRPAHAAAQQVPAAHEEQHRPGQREEVQPLVLRQRQAGGRIGLDDHHAHGAAGPVLQRLVLEDLRHRHAEREGREREVEPLQPQRGQPEQEAGGEAHQRPRPGS